MPEMTLVTFNTHYGLRPPRERCRPYDLRGVLDGLAGADVLAIQEVWRPDTGPCVVEEFAADHGYEVHSGEFGRASIHRRWPGFTPEGEGTIGIALLSRLPTREVDRPLVGPTFRDPVRDRRMLAVEVDVGGTPARVVCVHLSSKLPHAPPLQLRKLSAALADVTGPAVVTGDCNFWGPPASLCMPGWTRAVRGRTWPAHRPHSQIDHVLVRGGVGVVASEVLPESGSDHRPVRVTLRVG